MTHEPTGRVLACCGYLNGAGHRDNCEGELMTDREKLLALLDEWGVGYNGKYAERNRFDSIDFDRDVMVCAGDTKIDGYSNFFAVFEFEPDGTFRQITVWE